MKLTDNELNYVDSMASKILAQPRTGEELVRSPIETIGQILQYLCVVSDVNATIELTEGLILSMKEHRERLTAMREGLLTTLDIRRDLAEIPIIETKGHNGPQMYMPTL